jgi:hypothetical protein
VSERVPFIDPAVVVYFESLFRDRCPAESDSDRAIWMSVGSARVVRKMRQISDELSGNVLNRSVLDHLGEAADDEDGSAGL